MIRTSGDEECSSVAILEKNNFSLSAIKHLVEQSKGSGTVLTYRSSNDFLSALSKYSQVDTVIVSCNILYSEEFSVLDALRDYFPNMNIIVVLSNPNANVISFIRSLNIKRIISDIDDISYFHEAITAIDDEESLSPVISKMLENDNNQITPPPRLLTAMERYVLRYLISGVSPSLIASWKGISVKTVSSHKNQALKKINIQKLHELVLCPKNTGN